MDFHPGAAASPRRRSNGGISIEYGILWDSCYILRRREVLLFRCFFENPANNCRITEVFQCRIDKKLVAQARKVTEDIGTTPGEVVRIMFAQMVKRRAIPFPLIADSPEDEVLGPVKRRAAMWDELR